MLDDDQESDRNSIRSEIGVSFLCEWSLWLQTTIESSVLGVGHGDVTGDGREEVVVCTNNGTCFILDLDGNILWFNLGVPVRAFCMAPGPLLVLPQNADAEAKVAAAATKLEDETAAAAAAAATAVLANDDNESTRTGEAICSLMGGGGDGGEEEARAKASRFPSDGDLEVLFEENTAHTKFSPCSLVFACANGQIRLYSDLPKSFGPTIANYSLKELPPSAAGAHGGGMRLRYMGPMDVKKLAYETQNEIDQLAYQSRKLKKQVDEKRQLVKLDEKHATKAAQSEPNSPTVDFRTGFSCSFLLSFLLA
jgi:hypothetical protein